jgi:transcriptional regulator with XRE-family HTH domain
MVSEVWKGEANMSINERIKQVRQSLNLSQAKFAKDISISNGYIAGIELGNRKVNDRIVKLICSAYGVNEMWLKTGEGKMFDSKLNAKLEQATTVFKQLKPEFQDYVMKQLDQLLALQNSLSEDN